MIRVRQTGRNEFSESVGAVREAKSPDSTVDFLLIVAIGCARVNFPPSAQVINSLQLIENVAEEEGIRSVLNLLILCNLLIFQLVRFARLAQN
jgi:hypothetical protein